MHIAAVGRALPDHFVDQETLIGAFRSAWAARHHNVARIEQLHRNAMVGGRHLALPAEAYLTLDFTSANEAFVRVATEVGGRAVMAALEAFGAAPTDVDAIWFTTVTGVAAPSIDARLVNRLGFRSDIKRTPIFGLGCVAGAAGVARAADYLVGHPDALVVLLSVELCSLTLQKDDLSIPNLVATGLFGDGAAAVVLTGASRSAVGPRIAASRSVFYPDTEDVMGWQVGSSGFRIVLSSEVPDMVRRHLRDDIRAFLADHGLGVPDIAAWVAHPGGPKVLEALQEELGLPRAALQRTWDSLAAVGNLSSSSVQFVLADTLADPPPPGGWGLLIAMGPGFCSELVLLQW